MKGHRARQCHAESAKQQQCQQKMDDYCLIKKNPSDRKIFTGQIPRIEFDE